MIRVPKMLHQKTHSEHYNSCDDRYGREAVEAVTLTSPVQETTPASNIPLKFRFNAHETTYKDVNHA